MKYYLFSFLSVVANGDVEQNFFIVCADSEASAIRVFRQKYPWPVQIVFNHLIHQIPSEGDVSSVGFQTFKTNPFK